MSDIAPPNISLKEQAYSHIKKLILTEEIPVNSFLSERSLAEQLGMSKTPVKLAIERLENEGFVRVSPQQGIMVLALSFEEIIDYIDYRLALESFVVERITGQLGRAQVELLRANLKEHEEVLENYQDKDQSEKLILVDMAYHRLLFAFKANKQISLALGHQQDMIYRIANRCNQKYPARPEQAYQEHLAIAEAIIAGDKAQAVLLISQHIEAMKALLIGQIGSVIA